MDFDTWHDNLMRELEAHDVGMHALDYTLATCDFGDKPAQSKTAQLCCALEFGVFSSDH